MKYEILYREVSEGWFDVEADDEVAACAKFWEMVGNGEIDLMDTEIMTGEIAGVY